jgi:hypothetical protein
MISPMAMPNKSTLGGLNSAKVKVSVDIRRELHDAKRELVRQTTKKPFMKNL